MAELLKGKDFVRTEHKNHKKVQIVLLFNHVTCFIPGMPE